MELEKLTPDNDGGCACTQCDSDSFTLAIDLTQYSRPQLLNGTWRHGPTINTEPSDTRFLCTYCGAYYEVPEELMPW